MVMNLKDMDIVYVVKDSAYNDELKYSLRSVEKNFPHNRVWFYGGKPIGIHPDKQVAIVQKGKTKWDKVRSLIGMICENDEITEDFVLFNDDFFVLQPVVNLPSFCDGTLDNLANKIIEKNNGRPSPYTNKIIEASILLKKAKRTTHNFELHAPMIINREKMLKTRERFPDAPASRSLYGNYNKLKPRQLNDTKIVSLRGKPGLSKVFVSTEDRSFSDGEVGEYIRSLFPTKSRWEK